MTRTEKLRTCQRKRKYTEDGAKHRAWQLNQEGHYIHAYRCTACGGWHVGHVSKRRRVWMAFERVKTAYA